MTAPRRLLSIAHSYVVALNRRLAHEMQRVGGGNWEVTAVAPEYFHDDLRPIHVERLPDEPCRLEIVPAYLTSRIHVMLYGSRLREILSERWDVVHCWEEPYILVGAQVAFWTPREVPLVYRTVQNIAKRYPPPFNWIERYCVSRCAGWVGSGHTVVDTLLPRGYDRRPHRHIPLGVDMTTFYPDPRARAEVRAKLSWPEPGPPVVGYLGRFVPQKGLTLLTRALDRLQTPWRALFIGDGPQEGFLRAWAARHGDRVRILTGVRHAQVPAHLNAMDVLCAPSQTTPKWREQFGRMLIEGFASGVPVLGSDSGEIPRVLEGAGIVVGEADEDAWVEELSSLLESPARRADLAARGLERARAHYAWPVIARNYLAFFEDLMAKGGGR